MQIELSFGRRRGVGWILHRLHHLRVPKPLVALCIYGLAALLMTYPVIIQIDSVIAGDVTGDAYQYAWSLWRAKQVLFDPGKNLGHVNLLNHPVGLQDPGMRESVGFHVMTLPASLLLSPAAAYNSQILTTLVLNGMAMYALCMEMVGSHKAALVSGFIFAFSPNNLGHAVGGHLPQLTMYWTPLYALFLHRTNRAPGWGNALGSALALTFSCLIRTTYITHLVLPVTIAVFLMSFGDLHIDFLSWRRCAFLMLVLLFAASMTAPFLLPALSPPSRADGYPQRPDPVEHSFDLLAFLIPSPYHPILKVLGLVPSRAETIFPDLGALHEGLTYPGLLPVTLALWGVIQQYRKARLWGAVTLVAAVFSLGPVLKIGGESIPQIPMLNTGPVPSYLGVTVMFGIAVLASYGIATLSSQIAARKCSSRLLVIFLLIGIGLEFLVIWPLPVSSAEIPPAIRRISTQPGNGALLHLGMDQGQINDQALYYQTATRRPIVGGETVSAASDNSPWAESLFGLVQAPDRMSADIVPRPTPTERIGWLDHFGIDYVILHRYGAGYASSSGESVERILEAPGYVDQKLAVFAVPENAPSPEASRLYTFSSQGWRQPQRDDSWLRWMSKEDGLLYLYSTHEEDGSLRFAIAAPRQLNFPTLTIYLGGNMVDEFLVGNRTTYTSRSITIKEGMNVLRFHASEECEDMDADSSDCRLLALDHVSFVPRDQLPPNDLVGVNFDNQMELRGWRTENPTPCPGDNLTLILTWRSKVTLSASHVVFVHIMSPDGELIAQRDFAPVGDLLTTSAWPEGTTFGFPVTIELSSDLPPGDYLLRTGVYLWPDLERLPVLADVPGAEINVAELGIVRVLPQ